MASIVSVPTSHRRVLAAVADLEEEAEDRAVALRPGRFVRWWYLWALALQVISLGDTMSPGLLGFRSDIAAVLEIAKIAALSLLYLVPRLTRQAVMMPLLAMVGLRLAWVVRELDQSLLAGVVWTGPALALIAWWHSVEDARDEAAAREANGDDMA